MSNKAWMLKNFCLREVSKLFKFYVLVKNFDRKPVRGGLLINKGGGKGRPKDCLNKDRSSHKSHYVN